MKKVVAFLLNICYNKGSLKERNYNMSHNTSSLRSILNDVYTSKSLEEASSKLTVYLDSDTCAIRKTEARRIRIKASMCKSLLQLQQYVTNSFLKFEGYAVMK